jgi:predicted transcriptional regulator
MDQKEFVTINGTIVEAEMTFEEIAEELGITVQGARALYCRAIIKLQKQAKRLGLDVYLS